MSYKIDVFSIDGSKKEERQLSDSVFSDENINHTLIHEFVVLQEKNARIARAHTKTRGEVVSSGKKLFRQKGTGNARVGDAGSPIRKGGGTAFGPRKDVNYSKKMPKKMRRKALYGLLTLKARDNEICGIDDGDYNSINTKNAKASLENLGLLGSKSLVVVPELKEEYTKSFRNIDNVKYLLVDYLNPSDLLSYKNVVFFKGALDRLEG